jgi:chemotaxis protein histidine kinase CheA
MNDFQEKLNILKQGYLNKLRSEFEAFSALLTVDVGVEDIYSRVHKISGTGGMYGLKELSEISTVFEVYLKEKRENPESINQEELYQKFSQYLTELKNQIGE